MRKYRGKYQKGGTAWYMKKQDRDNIQLPKQVVDTPAIQEADNRRAELARRRTTIGQDNRTPQQKRIDEEAFLRRRKMEEDQGKDFTTPTSLQERNRAQSERIIHNLVDVPTTIMGTGELVYGVGKGLLRGVSKFASRNVPQSSQEITRGFIDWADTPGFMERNPKFNPRKYENSIKPGYTPPTEDPKLKAFLTEEKPTIDFNKNLEDLNFAKDFAKKYGYNLPSNIERIASSNELTNRTIRGMMNRHNTFVRGVSTNWKFLEEKNPEILRHLEGKGFDLSTEEGSKAAAEYMSTHIPIQTGYGRADLNSKVFTKGMDGLYTSNSIPTAEGYTYGNGYIVKVKKPTDFSSLNRQDWINKNNPSYYNDFLPSSRMFSTSELNKMSPVDADRLLNDAKITDNEHQRMLKYFEQSKNKKKELMNKYQINESSSINDDKFDSYMNELETEHNNIAKTIFDEDYNKKILRTERAPEFDADNRFQFPKKINEFIKSKGKDPMSFLKGTEEGEKVYKDITEIQKNPLNSNQRVIDYIKTNYPDYDLENRYAHYIHIGVPGEKVLEPVNSWKITPEIWKNKSRAHTNVYSKKLSALQKGGPIVSKYGQWKYPGQETIVPTEDGNITMDGVPYPVLGIDETGYQQMMYPNQQYKYRGKRVYEIPMMQNGGRAPIYTSDPNDPRLRAYNDSLNLYKNVTLPNIKMRGINKYVHNPNNHYYNYEYQYYWTKEDVIRREYNGNKNKFERDANIYQRARGNKTGIIPEILEAGEDGKWNGDGNFKKPVQPVIYQQQPDLNMVGADRPTFPSFMGNIPAPVDRSIAPIQTDFSATWGENGKQETRYFPNYNTWKTFDEMRMPGWMYSQSTGDRSSGHTTLVGKPIFQDGGEYDEDENDWNFLMDDSRWEEKPITDAALTPAIKQEKQNDYFKLTREFNRGMAMGIAMQEDEENIPTGIINSPEMKLSLRPNNMSTSGLSRFGKAYEDIDPNVAMATEELLKQFPGLRLTSGRRSWGDKDAHPKGRAVDLSYDKKAWEYYRDVLVPKYGFNKALDPNHGTGPHIHLGYY